MVLFNIKTFGFLLSYLLLTVRVGTWQTFWRATLKMSYEILFSHRLSLKLAVLLFTLEPDGIHHVFDHSIDTRVLIKVVFFAAWTFSLLSVFT